MFGHGPDTDRTMLVVDLRCGVNPMCALVLVLHPDTGCLAPQLLEFVGVQGWSKWASAGYQSLFFLVFCGATLVAFHFVRYEQH